MLFLHLSYHMHLLNSLYVDKHQYIILLFLLNVILLFLDTRVSSHPVISLFFHSEKTSKIFHQGVFYPEKKYQCVDFKCLNFVKLK